MLPQLRAQILNIGFMSDINNEVKIDKRRKENAAYRDFPFGRPEKEVDWKKVDDLLIAGCLGTEIAAHFDMHPNTFYAKIEERYKVNFTQYSFEKKSQGESLLRAHQYAKALGLTDKGDNTLLIWLGKTRLNQREIKDDVEKESVEMLRKISESLKISDNPVVEE